MRQGVPEGRSSEGFTSFKQVKSWPWHIEVIPEVSVVGLVTNEELCQVVWGAVIIIIIIIIKKKRRRTRRTRTKR